jgi:hypothetical protein
MNARKNFRLPLRGAEQHHNQTYASRKVRKTLDTTLNPVIVWLVSRARRDRGS